jgi:hypothetical protein
MGLSCILPCHECVQSLSKFCSTHDIFICDFVVQVSEDDLYQMCVDPITS